MKHALNAVASIITLAAIGFASVPARAENFCGFSYGPFVGQWFDNPHYSPQDPLSRYLTPAWGDTYNAGNWSVTAQINLIAQQATRLSTYGAGVFEWNGAPAPNFYDTALIAPAVAARNVANPTKPMTLYQGIYQEVVNGRLGSGTVDAFTPNSIMSAEVAKAVGLATSANATHAGTVVGLVFTNEYAHDETSTSDVRGVIKWYKAQNPSLNLPVAVRIESWGQIQNSGDYPDQLKLLAKEIDIVMMNLYPAPEAVRASMAAGNAQPAVDNVASFFNTIKNYIHANVSSSVRCVLSETGWPVAGVWYEDGQGKIMGDPTYAKDYFNRIKTWANANQTEVFYFEAINEPWKSNKNWTPQDGPWPIPPFPYGPPPFYQRIDGAEGNFGVWSYTTSNAGGQFNPNFALDALWGGEPDADADNDLIADHVDNCPYIANPAQIDSDADGIGNICDGPFGINLCGAAGLTSTIASFAALAFIVTARRIRRPRRLTRANECAEPRLRC